MAVGKKEKKMNATSEMGTTEKVTNKVTNKVIYMMLNLDS